MLLSTGIIFCTPIARLISSTVITGCSVSNCTMRNSLSVRSDSSPVKSGCIETDDSLASLKADGKAIAITSPT